MEPKAEIFCAACKSGCPVGATTCTECGHNPGPTMRKMGLLIFGAGLVALASVVASPLALLLMPLGLWRWYRGTKATVATDYDT